MTASSLHAYLRVRVVPRASRTALSRDAQGVVRAHVNAPPVGGAANRALLALLADSLDLPKSAFQVVQGERSRDKLVCVEGCSALEIDVRLTHVLGNAVDKAQRRR